MFTKGACILNRFLEQSSSLYFGHDKFSLEIWTSQEVASGMGHSYRKVHLLFYELDLLNITKERYLAALLLAMKCNSCLNGRHMESSVSVFRQMGEDQIRQVKSLVFCS